jgi:uncharacterized membrane protein
MDQSFNNVNNKRLWIYSKYVVKHKKITTFSLLVKKSSNILSNVSPQTYYVLTWNIDKLFEKEYQPIEIRLSHRFIFLHFFNLRFPMSYKTVGISLLFQFQRVHILLGYYLLNLLLLSFSYYSKLQSKEPY